MGESKLTRREFLKKAGKIGLGAALAGTPEPPKPTPTPTYRIPPWLAAKRPTFAPTRVPTAVAAEAYLPELPQRKDVYYYQDVIYKGPDIPKVAITIDDGWWPENIKLACDFCQKYRFKATFFVMAALYGEKNLRPALERARELGCEFQNHTWRQHPDLAKLAREGRTQEIYDDIKRSQDKIMEFSRGEGGSGQFLRPPFGSYNTAVVKICHSLGLEVVSWSRTSNGTARKADGSLPDCEEVLKALKGTGRGEIVLLHTNWNDMGALERYWLEILEPKGLIPILLSELTPSRFK